MSPATTKPDVSFRVTISKVADFMGSELRAFKGCNRVEHLILFA
jgi:hypothetical protein